MTTPKPSRKPKRERITDTKRLRVVSEASIDEGKEIFGEQWRLQQNGVQNMLVALRRAIDAAIRQGRK